jgi:maltose alpha-D-glucosyltransferase/alpha-amylase
MPTERDSGAREPLWYKDAILYELHVKTFYDSNGDGLGDFRGLLEKLDYLENLGVTAVWLLPFYPSPLKDDGYDIADYFQVHPDYGTLRDFRAFLAEAHRRGMRVITELVMNHTSDQHAWFQRARRSPPGSRWRNYYVWNDTPERYKEARVIFKDFETSNWSWDHLAQAYYWHRFYSHQPDLNFDNPEVHQAMRKVLDFWLGMGVDGLRLDAVPYLYEREGTNCENLPETYEYLRDLRLFIDSRYNDRMILAEANQWPEDAAAYLGKGDMCHMAFHFPLMPRMYIALQQEDRFPILDILDQTPAIPETCQWAMFLRNHDELTLEMVTDEERDYMYRVYAKDARARINLGIRRRLAPLLSNDRNKIELMNILLLSLPGTPVIYYGDEIGMGDNYYLGDRNGVRTPMQWIYGKNAGFSNANPQSLYLPVIIDPEYHYEAINVETQERNPASLLWWMKRGLAIRKSLKAFGRGSLEFLYPANPKILAFLRKYGEEVILIAVNLSRFSQVAELDLAAFAGYEPEELYSRSRFPPVRGTPYLLTFGPYGYYGFVLKRQESAYRMHVNGQVPELRTRTSWRSFPDEGARRVFERQILPPYVQQARWFAEKALALESVRVVENIPIPVGEEVSHLLLLEVSFTEGGSSLYLFPLSLAVGEKAGRILDTFPNSVLARLYVQGAEGYVYEAIYDEEFCRSLLRLIAQRRKVGSERGDLETDRSRILGPLLRGKGLNLSTQVLRAEQSNSSILFESLLYLKLYRRLEEGVSTDVEITRFLSEKAAFPHVPRYAGSLQYRRGRSAPVSIGLLQEFVPNQGDFWSYTLGALNKFYDRILAEKPDVRQLGTPPAALPGVDAETVPPPLEALVGGLYIEMIRLLGRRTAELHRALASEPDDPRFAPEPFTTLYQRSLYQSMRALARRSLLLLARRLDSLPERGQALARQVLQLEKEILGRQHEIVHRKLSGLKIRIHGDYHLGQVLFTGKDFVIIDFEGEPARALSERKLKRLPLRDVAGMIRSFHYAARASLKVYASARPEDMVLLEPWAEPWYIAMSGVLLSSYLEVVGDSALLPRDRGDAVTVLRTFTLDKALYELFYELNNRPDWVDIPLTGILQLMERTAAPERLIPSDRKAQPGEVGG